MNIFFQSSEAPQAQSACREFIRRYGQAPSLPQTDVIVSLGGDGRTLVSLQDAIRHKKPVFGINFGHLGHYQNKHIGFDGLPERIERAERLTLYPLKVEARFRDGSIKHDFAVSEALICNHVRTATIHLRVSIGGRVHIENLSGDGLIVATTVGSTGYNRSAYGPVLPLDDDLIVLTPNNPQQRETVTSSIIRPKLVEVQVLDPLFRQADVHVDNHAVGEAADYVRIELDRNNPYELLFDRGDTLHDKITRTQFPLLRS